MANLNDINVDGANLKTNAQTMKTEIQNMKDALKDATIEINQSENFLKGQVGNTIRNKYSELEGKFNSFYEAMVNYADFLEKTANVYEEQERNISKSAEDLLTSDYNS